MDDLIGLDALAKALNSDPEFQIAARHWDVRLCLAAGETETILHLRDGRLTEVDRAPTPLHEWDVAISAPVQVWREMLARCPRPFYQDFFPAMLHHGLRLQGDLESLFAYYPAIRRMGDVMREVSNA